MSINDAFKNFVISSLHSGMFKKSKLRVYRELTEDLECKKYLHGVSDMGSKLSFRFRSGTHGLNEELGRHSSRNSSKTCFFFFVSVSANLKSIFYGNAQSILVFVRNLLKILMGFYRTTFI